MVNFAQISQMISFNTLKRKNLLINGVYQILNVKTKKSYIGSSSSKTFIYERIIHHRYDLIANRHGNTYLQNSFNKHGIENFVVVILEVCQSKYCLKKEQYWIDKLKPEYNIAKKAGNTLGVVFSEERKKNISKAVQKWHNEHPEFAEKMRNSKKGKTLSKKHRQAIVKGLIGKKHSDKTKNKMSKSAMKKVLNIDTGIIYKSATEASTKLKCSLSLISQCCNGTKKSFNLKYV